MTLNTRIKIAPMKNGAKENTSTLKKPPSFFYFTTFTSEQGKLQKTTVKVAVTVFPR